MSFKIQFLLPFARAFGFFLISPLFSFIAIPQAVRVGLAFFVALLLAPFVPAPSESYPPWALLYLILRDFAIGYLLGITFALLFEGAKLGGEMIGTLTGFSTSELFDPASISPSLFGRLFYLLALALFLSFDLHHFFFYLLQRSFTADLLSFPSLLKSASLFLSQALEYAFAPFVALSLLFILFAFFSRLFPTIPLFFIALPLQIFLGVAIVAFSISRFAPVLKRGVFELLHQLLGN